MTKDQENNLESVIRQRFRQQYEIGLRAGILAASRIVLDKLNQKDKPLMERIRDVQNFCNVAVKSDDFLDVHPEKDASGINHT